MNVPIHPRRALVLAIGVTAAIALGACGSTSNSAAAPAVASNPSASAQVLPVTGNPIANPSTVNALRIDSVLAENNTDPATGKATDDHLEVALTNTGTSPLTNFEVFYTFSDPTATTTESYYLALPATFTIDAGASRTAHFDNSGATDHFPVNSYSLYHSSPNALDVTVVVSAKDSAPQTAVVHKDAGGPEQAD